ncbi:MAG: BMP family ABC transporter substrate-binding protein [Planctomycetes bacterium]|nr:BMP family ABC transporter substrate-binding protein [Planctomycetota bacterium]
MRRAPVLLSLFALLSLAVLPFAGCGDDAEDDPGKLKVAFVYVGPIGDAGWTYAHDQGRLAIEKEFPDVETACAENVPEGPEARSKIEQYARHGYRVVFTTSFGFMDPTQEVAKDYPDVLFMHCSGYKRAKNAGTYFGRMEEAWYLAGLVAGKTAGSGKIGYVTPFPIPEVIRFVNAFTLGAREANPNAEVRVVWIHSWFDPTKEKEAALSLIETGADLIVTGCDSSAPLTAAQEKGKLAIGYDSDNRKAAPDAFLTAPIWNWGVVYTDFVRKVRAGEIKDLSDFDWWGGMKEGVVALAPFSDKVGPEARTLVEKRTKDILAGTHKVFQGPVVRQDGSIAIPEGEAATQEELLTMRYFVQGVQGEIPAGSGE